MAEKQNIPGPTRPLVLRGVTFDPPRFSAPMAGITHSAFRRLLADLGGYGALWTEMLAARQLQHDDLVNSPWLKRRPAEGNVVYQLMVAETKGLADGIARLAELQPDGLDLNTSCPAPNIRRQQGGAQLFEDAGRLRDVVREMRRAWGGPLTAKLRLGRPDEDWRERLMERIRVLEGEGVDALILHPRFTDEKFKRSARHRVYAEIASVTALPVIASGDLLGPETCGEQAAALAPVQGIMLGRALAARPWLLGHWNDPEQPIDHAAIWERLCDYIEEDFPPDKALMRIRILAPYYARNFVYGHTFFAAVQGAPDLATARRRSREFLGQSPPLLKTLSLEGI